ncbi:unnamed protein product [Rhizoctonia solani]|uniref:Transmembrane protein n=1 Tax=Rhizoctonia solani TaxID=456999 RepID=A0A8H3HAN2_9AGAM|nr:unnamed protein product [Rhizoctonia solani]
MIFNLFVLIFWLLALISRVGDYSQYIQLLSDASITAPDIPTHTHMVSESVLFALAPAPAPGTRYSPLVVPLYLGRVKVPKPSKFILEKRIFAIYKWIAHVTDLVARTRPTKTSRSPTRIVAPIYPAPPTAGHYVLDDAPAQTSASPVMDLAGIWDAYGLIFGWIFSAVLAMVFTFIRFLSRDNVPAYLADPSADDIHSSDDASIVSDIDSLAAVSLDSFSSIIDIYCALGFPPVTPDDIPFDSNLTNHAAPADISLTATTDNKLFEITTSSGSVCTDAVSALPAWIDTKTGVEGKTDMNGTSVEGKTLEPAVSNSSIGSIVRLYAGESPAITPSSSHSSLAPSSEELLSRYPPTGQVHTPRSERWLEGFIAHLQGMERQGNNDGRVYDGWTTNPDLEPQVDTPDTQGTPSPNMSSQPSFGSELSVTASQGSLYELLGCLVSAVAEHTGGHLTRGQVGVEVKGIANVRLPHLHPADMPLPPSPYVGPQAAIVQEEDENKKGLSIRTAGINPLDVPPSLSPIIDWMEVISVDTSELVFGE